MLRLYGVITQYGEINLEMLFYIESTLYGLLHNSQTYEFWRTIMDTPTSRSNILYAFISSCYGKMSTAQCFHIKQQNASNTLDWEKYYKGENGNFRIIYRL